MLGVQNGNQPRGFSKHGFHFLIQFHPIKISVFGIWVYSDDPAVKPALAFPVLGIEEYLYTAADLEIIGYHGVIIREIACLEY